MIVTLTLAFLAFALPALAAGPMFWDLPGGRPFADCRLEGVTIDGAGRLSPGLVHGRGADLPGGVTWCVVPDPRGGILAGTGHEGQIVRIVPDGEPQVYADLEAPEVFCLLTLDDGRLLAGCGPEGQVYAVAPDGTAAKIGDAAGQYVWGMAQDPAGGRVWLVSGSPATVQALDLDTGRIGDAVTLPAENALDVLPEPDGSLLVSTQGPGMVYRVTPGSDGEPELLLETAQDEARRLLQGPDGGIYLVALAPAEAFDLDGDPEVPDLRRRSVPVVMLPFLNDRDTPRIPRGAVYRIDGDLPGSLVWSGDLDLMFATWDHRLGWIAGGGLIKETGLATLYRLDPPAGYSPLTSWAGGDILDILVEPDGNRPAVAVAQANPGRIDWFGDDFKAARTATGPVLDAGKTVAWGRLSWQGEPGPGGVRWSVRTGNRAIPDGGWTAWSKTWKDHDVSLDLPASRYLQWRAEFLGDQPDPARAHVAAVTVSAFGPNFPPVISEFKQEDVQSVFMGGLMNHRDNITRSFRSGLKAEFNRGSDGPEVSPEGRAALGGKVLVFSWKVTDPDDDRLEHTLFYRPWAGSPGRYREASKGNGEGVDGWDTSDVPDGLYEMILSVTDAPDNPGHLAHLATSKLGPVRVDNTPPVVSDFGARVKDQGIHLFLKAADGSSPLAGAMLVLPDGTRERLDPLDRICDSLEEEFDFVYHSDPLRTTQLPAWVRIEVMDLAGNVTAVETDVESR
ncbi:MAG: hypothetical protein AB7V45_15980 [Candidatus Krumholzibacteriia bacterium]